MKFTYADESGAPDQGDVFVMSGLMVDAVKLRKKTADFDKLLEELLAKHPGSPNELKTKAFINGNGGWNTIPGDERKDFLRAICQLAVANGGKIFAIGISFENFQAVSEEGLGQPFAASYWVGSAMSIAALIQKKMQKVSGKKGLTALIIDDNKMEMTNLSNGLYRADAWYDALYQIRGTVRGKTVWLPRKAGDRFDQIINSAFAIKSDHSSLVQVADAISYVYRRYLELSDNPEAYPGEQEFYNSLVEILEPARLKLGHAPNEPATQFFSQAAHAAWQL